LSAFTLLWRIGEWRCSCTYSASRFVCFSFAVKHLWPALSNWMGGSRVLSGGSGEVKNDFASTRYLTVIPGLCFPYPSHRTYWTMPDFALCLCYKQECTVPSCIVPQASTFCAVAPNIWTFTDTLLGSRIFMWLIDF
jgi:hypothetical protein